MVASNVVALVALILGTLTASTALATAAAPADSGQRVVAWVDAVQDPVARPKKGVLLGSKTISLSGGNLRIRGGAGLKIPRGALRRPTAVSIWWMPSGHYDYRIAGRWRGQVRVTVPRTKGDGVVMHAVGGTWQIESSAPGKSAVWVDHLSPFDWVTCFKSALNPAAVVQCLIKKNIKTISRSVAAKILGKAADACWPASLVSIPVTMVLDANCVGQLDPGTYTYPTQPQPQPAFEPTFPVMNTSEQPPDGVWFRNSPSTGDTPRITGHGVYAGDTVKVACYAWGESVGSYGNQVWYYAKNITRPTVPSTGTVNQGWINTHYVNDGRSANSPYPGIRVC